MMRFNTLLRDADIDPADVRLLRHSPDVGGRSLLGIWHTNPQLLLGYQALQQTSARSSFARRYWASFIGTPDGRTVFVGLHEVIGLDEMTDGVTEPIAGRRFEAGTMDRYNTRPVETLSEYRGRLFVDWGGGASGKRAWNQRADIQDKLITELQLNIQEQPFPGLLKINAPLSRIATMPPAWISHLREAQGVYLLSCPSDGSRYVGSATSAGGFWSRWSEYLANGHGGNIGLTNRPTTDFYATILQVAGSADEREDILATEVSWKEKLRTREWGLNRN